MLNKTEFLAEDNNTYDMEKVDSLLTPEDPIEMTPEDFILQGEGTQVAGLASSLGRGLKRFIKPSADAARKYKQRRPKGIFPNQL